MLIGIPREIKDHEFRVGATPAGVRALIAAGHALRVQSGAGDAIGFDDGQYRRAGAEIVADAAAAWDAELVIKVKEPQSAEFAFLRADRLLFTYLHLAAEPAVAQALLAAGSTAIAYETVQTAQGSLPLLTPMSEVAGRIAVQAGAGALQMIHGGRGVLLGGVPGVPPAKVVILGGGTVGSEAAKIALGMGADVTLLDISLPRLRQLDDLFGPALKTCYSEPQAIEHLSADADLLIGAVLIPGKRAPRLIDRAMVRAMRRGAVLVDVAIDQGGCAETSRPTTHSRPTYIDEEVVHYCVTNMPAACARTATQALTSATLPYALQIGAKGLRIAEYDSELRNGINLHRGEITHAGVAESLGMPCHPL